MLGFTLQIDSHHVSRLASQLTTLTKTGLINPDKLNDIQHCLNTDENKVYFSKREMDVLSLVVKGFTAKKISIILGLSKRTVEHHIDNLKLKSGCARKYELIYSLQITHLDLFSDKDNMHHSARTKFIPPYRKVVLTA